VNVAYLRYAVTYISPNTDNGNIEMK